MNEPVANACRTCGRWPSLFELEGSTIEAEQQVKAPPKLYEPEVVQPEYLEPEIHDAMRRDMAEPVEVEEYEMEDEDAEPPKPLWQRLTSLIIPIGVVLYIVISALVNNDSG